jgi:predicted nucleotidyltransferase
MDKTFQNTFSKGTSDLFQQRKIFSKAKLDSLISSLDKTEHIKKVPDLCIFAAGSYGRLEASEHSDIDLFFVTTKPKDEIQDINVPKIRLFSDVIDVGYKLGFPKFSNDGEYLKLLFLEEIERNMGSRDDDFLNHFTTRMLLLLESRPVYGFTEYENVLSAIIDAYFRDYTHHPSDFKPTFLVNDIVRFWKTLCLNYEHGRNQEGERTKIKQKIKNFKLKYSRLMTCFATISCLSTYKGTISPTEVISVCHKTPSERLHLLSDFNPALVPTIGSALESYAWFMELTGLSKEDLEEHFSDKEKRADAFTKAQKFGDILFKILLEINDENSVLRYMVL